MMFKKLIIVILAGLIPSQIDAMKRGFIIENTMIENPFKKIKIDDSEPRQSLFSLFERNDVEGFRREAEWRNKHDKNSLNERDLSGETILYRIDGSKKNKSDECFQILIKNGADINIGNLVNNMTVLSAAMRDLEFKRMERALSAGADPNIDFGVDKELPLSFLLAKPDMKIYPQQSEVIRELCSKVDFTKKSGRGDTVLHSRLLSKSMARIFLLKGADPEMRNANNNEPKDVCWNPETCELLELPREAIRKEVIMPAIEHQIKEIQKFDKGKSRNITDMLQKRQTGSRSLTSSRLM